MCANTMSENETIMTKMQKVEESLKGSLHRVDVIEKKLSAKLLTMEQRERLETKLEEVKDELRKNEQKLQSLRKQNTMSFMIASSLVFACFLLYGLYLMIFRSI